MERDEYEKRWRSLPESWRHLARKDAALACFLECHIRSKETGLRRVREDYLRHAWEAVETWLRRFHPQSIETWRRLWPTEQQGDERAVLKAAGIKDSIGRLYERHLMTTTQPAFRIMLPAGQE